LALIKIGAGTFCCSSTTLTNETGASTGVYAYVCGMTVHVYTPSICKAYAILQVFLNFAECHYQEATFGAHTVLSIQPRTQHKATIGQQQDYGAQWTYNQMFCHV